MNSKFYLILFAFLMYKVHCKTESELSKIAENFHSEMVRKLTENLECKFGAEKEIQKALCQTIENLEGIFRKMRNIKDYINRELRERLKAQAEEDLANLRQSLENLILKDFDALNRRGIHSILGENKINELETGLTNLMHKWREAAKMEKGWAKMERSKFSIEEMKKMDELVEESARKRMAQFLMMQIEQLKAISKNDHGVGQNVKELAVECILALNKLINGGEGIRMDLATAFSVFGVELLAYSVKIPKISAEMEKWPIEFN